MDAIKNKEILYLSYDGMTDALGQSQVLPYLFGLSKLDYNIHLISFEKNETFSVLNEEISILCKQNNISWYPLKYTKKPPVFSTMWDIYRMTLKAKKLQRQYSFSLVHCRSYLPGMVGLNLKRKFGVKFLFDMRGFWADERVDGGQWNLNKLIFKKIYKFFKKKELDLFSNCDECVSLTEIGKRELLTWKLNRNDKLTVNVIPCCVDLKHFDYSKINEKEKSIYLKKYNIQSNDIVICYLGSLSTVYLFDEVLKTIAKIEEKYTNYKFLIFTHEDKQLVQKYISDSEIKKLDNIYIDSLTRKKVPAALSICSYSIFFCKPSYPRKGTSPTRLAELIACGVSIISNKDIGDSEKHIIENNLGYVFEDFKEENFNRFLNDFDLNKGYPKNELRIISEKLFSLDNGIKKYALIYKRLLK
jgi:glycosyltransferase involved in cell wall biosynthesis